MALCQKRRVFTMTLCHIKNDRYPFWCVFTRKTLSSMALRQKKESILYGAVSQEGEY